MTQFVIINPADTALLVIDVQRALFTRPNPVHESYKLIETINALVSRAHLYGVQVIYIQHANDSILKAGTDGWKLHPDLKPKDYDITVQKTHGNALVEPALQSALEARNTKNLIITGLVTQNCIRSTSLGGLQKGYQVFLIQGAHSNYNVDAERVIEQKEAELAEAGVVLVTPERIDFA